MNIDHLEWNEDGTLKPGQIFYDNDFYWLITTKGKLISLGTNSRCATLDGAHVIWRRVLDRAQEPNETTLDYTIRQKRTQDVLNELEACGAKLHSPKAPSTIINDTSEIYTNRLDS